MEILWKTKTFPTRIPNTTTTAGPLNSCGNYPDTGGYLLDCKDLDEAIEYAAKIPSAKHGAIEIRPIMKFD